MARVEPRTCGIRSDRSANLKLLIGYMENNAEKQFNHPCVPFVGPVSSQAVTQTGFETGLKQVLAHVSLQKINR